MNMKFGISSHATDTDKCNLLKTQDVIAAGVAGLVHIPLQLARTLLHEGSERRRFV
jgi:hypothetical protein